MTWYKWVALGLASKSLHLQSQALEAGPRIRSSCNHIRSNLFNTFLSTSLGVSFLSMYWLKSFSFSGYGNLAPSTRFGQLFLIVYALFGIPLCLLFISSVGQYILKITTWIADHVNLFTRFPKLEQASDALIIAISGWIIMVVGPACVFYIVHEDWSFINSFYFSFVTISTIGFGDYFPRMYYVFITKLRPFIFGRNVFMV